MTAWQFDDNDSDSLMLSDIRELLYLLTWQSVASSKQIAEFRERRMITGERL